MLNKLAAFDDPERVMYPRRHRPQPLRRSPLVGGTPVTEEIAMGLRRVVFGHSNAPSRSEWLRTAIVFREPDADLSYGLRLPRNGTRSLLAAVQAHVIKHLIFPPPPPRPHPKVPGAALRALRPSAEKQQEALWQSLADIIWRAGERARGIVCLSPCATTGGEGAPSYVAQSSVYFQDGVTERLRIFEFHVKEDLEIFLKCYAYIFQEDPGPGALLLLYSAVLSRGLDEVRTDLGEERFSLLSAVSPNAPTPSGPTSNQLSNDKKPKFPGGLPPTAVMPTDSSAEEGPECIVALALTGRATPYLHNGVIYVGDENTYARPRYGIPCRSEVGFLVWRGDADDAAAAAMASSAPSSASAPPEDGRHPGSRLKTPSLPVWVTFCGGHYGVVFNTNRELLRDYHAERRFDLYYYSGGHTGNHTLLSVDTRFAGGGGGGGIFGMMMDDSYQNGNKPSKSNLGDINGAPPLEHLIHTKWRDAQVTWNGTIPHV
ncbi:inactive ubiquitin carboxyl-terminal hydrolase MINDY-4B isoform X2 [Ischnura elegans]|uniref:inactive ubiquitin carboxyl-terminal hydrolase MINDY-4B isoform X2 n=1 Tax=Ischnura elegans TaxID=197161 RepID=UPI001ED8AC3D|nr:inactive ubiquitin carboxyl-terminal hydrolase MINDY-4B isoform X2 [Ischnura elegans]